MDYLQEDAQEVFFEMLRFHLEPHSPSSASRTRRILPSETHRHLGNPLLLRVVALLHLLLALLHLLHDLLRCANRRAGTEARAK